MSQIRQFKPNEVDTICGIVDSCGASPMDVFKAIRASKTLRGHPGAILNHARKAGLIIKNRDGTYSVPSPIINEKGGETIEKPVTPTINDKELTDIEYVKKYGDKYRDKTITLEEKDTYGVTIKTHSKDIWGVGGTAITLVDEIYLADESYHHRRSYLGEKTFHRFNNDLSNEHTFDNGNKIAEIIIKQLGRL